MCMRASGASELRKFWYFYILTLLFLSIFCRYSRYFVGTNDMLVGLHVPTNFLIYRQTLTLSKCMCMRLSGAGELRKFWHFYILNLLFLSIFCRYIRYFVGTNDMLVGSHVPTTFQMYRQISKCTDKNPKKHYWGGSCPPSGYANAYGAIYDVRVTCGGGGDSTLCGRGGGGGRWGVENLTLSQCARCTKNTPCHNIPY